MSASNYETAKTLDEYKLNKLDLLEEMYIFLSTEEIQHLMRLKSEVAVDQYAHSLILAKL